MGILPVRFLPVRIIAAMPEGSMKKNELLCLLLMVFCIIFVKIETAVGSAEKDEPDVYKLSQVDGLDLELLHLMGAVLYENVDEDMIVVRLYPDGMAHITVEYTSGNDAFWKSDGRFLKIFEDTDEFSVLRETNGNDIVFTADGVEIRGTLTDEMLTLFFDDKTFSLYKFTPEVFVPGGDVYKLYSMLGLTLSTLTRIGFDHYGLDSIHITLYPDGTASVSVPHIQEKAETVFWKLDGTQITFYGDGEELHGTLSGDGLILDFDGDKAGLVKVIDRDGILVHYPDDSHDLTVTNGVRGIGEKACYKKMELMTVVIPESVTFIGDEAFAECRHLRSVTIPASVTYIADNAFSGCGEAMLKVEPGSYAADYAKNKNLDYVYIWQDYEFRLQNDGTAEITAYKGSRKKVDFPSSVAGIRVSSIGNNIFSGNNRLTSVTIPEGVTSIGKFAFSNCSSLTSVSLPDGLTFIGEFAFSEDSSLKSVTLPDSVSFLGDKAFFRCKNLTSVTLPGGLTAIGNETFSGCQNLTSITLPDSLTTIGGGAFSNCGSLTALTIPDSVTSIGNSAFENCGQLTLTVGESSHTRKYADEKGINYLRQPWWDFEYSILADGTAEITRYSGDVSEPLILSEIDGVRITSIGDNAFENNKSMKTLIIPDNITAIGAWAFRNCTGLTSLSLPDSIVSIGSAAFYGCESLTSAAIPDGIKLINWNLFCGCGSLQSVTIPESVESIDAYAFKNCGSLVSVNIPDHVTSIGTEAFYGCSDLKSLAVPDSVTSIGSNAFKYCDQLELTVGKNSYAREYAIENWLKYAYAGAADNTAEPVTGTGMAGTEEFEISNGILVKYHGNASSAVIPDGVTSIGDQAFAEHENLSAVTIPNSVTAIGSRAFLSCGALAAVDIPDSVTSIGEGAFTGCRSLTSVTIPESITTIPQNAFGGCDALTSVSIPAGIISIGEKAFAGCPRLESVIIPANIASIADDAFNPNVKRFFIDENRTLVKFAFNGIASPVKIPDGVTAVGENVFNGLPMVSSVVIPDGVTSIGKGAFDWCVNLTTVTIPDSVTFIGEKAFANCENLTSVVIPSGISSIPANTFAGCSSLTSVTIPDGVSSIGDWAFTGCSSLTSLTLPESLESIGAGAFSLCRNLTSVIIPVNVKSIGNAAFSGCPLLKSVSLPKNTVFSADDTFDKTAELIFTEPDSTKSGPSGADSPDPEYTGVAIDPLYQEFLGFLKAYITAEDRKTVAVNNDTYRECLDVIDQSWWNIEDAGFVFADLDGNGTAELLLGNYKYGFLWFVYAADYGQLSAVLHSGYRNTFILNTDGTFLEDLRMSAMSSETRYYIYENGGIRQLQAADYNSRSHTPAEIEFSSLMSYDAPANEQAEPVREAKSYPIVEDIIILGSYEQDNNRGNGPEPIEWKVLSIENGQMLILSTKVLDAMAFNSSGTNSWDVSSLRKWIQGSFINQAFSPAEKELIRIVSHKAGPLDTYPDQDTVFILSMDEIHQYLPGPSDRQIAATPYAKDRGVFLGANGLACWWTRTYFSKGTAYNIWSNGELDHGDNVTANDGGVLPAVWIDIEKWMNLP